MSLFITEGFLMLSGMMVCILFFEIASGLPLMNSTAVSTKSTNDGLFEGKLDISKEKTHLYDDVNQLENSTDAGANSTEHQLFEGDLEISEEMIRHYYDVDKFENITGKRFVFHSGSRREKRGAAKNRELWPDATVYYSYGSGISTSRAREIRDSMNYWEDNTCLRFIPRSDQSNFIDFVNLGDGSCSSSIGMSGGSQRLKLGADKCYGFITHEVGHAIGFFHEQSRPDRDSYVRIEWSNVRNGRENSNFMKRTTDDINSLGVQYDYDSVMHYGQTFQSTNGHNTIEISNPTVYANQGRPTLGQLNHLSSKDTQQARLLYNCPRPGVSGRLKVNVRYARHLPDTDPWPFQGWPDPYVKVIGVDSGGSKVQRETSYQTTINPNWNTWLDLGVRDWRYFRIGIWDSDYDADDPMTISESVAVSQGTRTGITQCSSTSCSGYSGYFIFDFRLCPDGWDGPNCDIRRANLRFKIRYGRHLPDSDPWWNDSDPYVKVIAYDRDGSSVTRSTRYLDGDHNPDWNQWLYFDTGAWSSYYIKVWDSDYNADDALSNGEYRTISPGSHTSLRHNCHHGYVIFDYYFD